MKKNFFKNKLQIQFETCEQFLTTYFIKKNRESLHQFRVSVKKIRALMKLANYYDNHFDDKDLLAPVKIVYRQAAILRSRQVRLFELKKYFSPGFNKILSLEEKNIQLLETRFLNSNGRYYKHITKASGKCINKYPPISKKSTKNFLIDKEKEIHSFLIPFPHLNQLHELRKQVKQFLYVLKFSDDAFSYNYKKQTEINSLQEHIGQWHDHTLLQLYIKRSGLLKTITTTNLQLLENKNRKLMDKIQMHLRELKHG